MARRLASRALLLSIALPTGALAQAGIYLGAAATAPIGGFKEWAKPGWAVDARLEWPVQRGLIFTGGGFYGANSDRVGDSPGATKLVGLLGGLRLRLGDPSPRRMGAVVFYEAGVMKRDNRDGPGLTDERLIYSGGVGLAIPLSLLAELRIAAVYRGPWFSTDYTTVGLSAGIRYLLGRAPP